MKVVITATAKRDLKSIGDYIKADNPLRAVSFVQDLLKHCQTLAQSPQRHPLVPRYEYHGIRRSTHANYLIFYRVGTERIEVVHILQGAQDYESLLFPNQ